MKEMLLRLKGKGHMGLKHVFDLNHRSLGLNSLVVQCLHRLCLQWFGHLC